MASQTNKDVQQGQKNWNTLTLPRAQPPRPELPVPPQPAPASSHPGWRAELQTSWAYKGSPLAPHAPPAHGALQRRRGPCARGERRAIRRRAWFHGGRRPSRKRGHPRPPLAVPCGRGGGAGAFIPLHRVEEHGQSREQECCDWQGLGSLLFFLC